MKHLILVLFTCYTVLLKAQVPVVTDSARLLQQVVVKAYEQNRQLKEVSAAINYVGKPQLERFNNTSILPALNATPGVRMEERSPGSYRLNIRGSTLRSPFGVRNVKVYWNGIPFTDPGGGTYLNQLSYYNIHSIEVIKGPAGSLYGAGTGGALLINSQGEDWEPGTSLNYGAGSFNLHNLSAQVRLGSDERRNSFGFTHQTSDGYRDHTRMRRDVASWETRIVSSEKQELQASVLYGDLYYQTPGGLTEAQYKANPKAARGPAGMFPGADEAKAAIYQKTFLAGLNHTYRFSEQFQNSSVAYGAFSQIKNPTFRNYEKRSEPHFGARTVFSYQQEVGTLQYGFLFGGEAQKGFFNTKTFANNQGNPGAVQTDDDIDTWIYSAFLQIDLHLPGDWALSAGSSINKSSITIERLSVPGFVPVKRTFASEWAPRIALSKKITPAILLYASVAQGFSPPTTQEVLPSTSVISTGLNAEDGTNYEVGLKTSWLKQRLYIEVNAFHFQLRNAIVQRRDSSGADYFENAGSTRQEGIESQAYYQLLPHSGRFLTNAKLWVSHTLNRFRYRDFKQLTNDFSGKKIPSVANNTIAAGLDVMTKPGIYANITWFYCDDIPLNDANTAVDSSYNLLGGRIGFRKTIGKKITADLYFGIDNAFDRRYSLGNDINAAGNRFYNAAPGVNYFAGLAIQFHARRKPE
jgi:iron complex outermembrane recepter protein